MLSLHALRVQIPQVLERHKWKRDDADLLRVIAQDWGKYTAVVKASVVRLGVEVPEGKITECLTRDKVLYFVRGGGTYELTRCNDETAWWKIVKGNGTPEEVKWIACK